MKLLDFGLVAFSAVFGSLVSVLLIQLGMGSTLSAWAGVGFACGMGFLLETRGRAGQ